MKHTPEAFIEVLRDHLKSNVWMNRASCLGEAPSRSEDKTSLDPWFPERGSWIPNAEFALEACFKCPVRKECDALRDVIQPGCGIWAGRLQRRFIGTEKSQS